MVNDFKPKWHPYHGWLVQVAPQVDGFRFYCYDPDSLGNWDNRQVYLTYDQALTAGREFVDRYLAIVLLSELLAGWYTAKKISKDEYESAIRFQP
jgi:hypothetical protein